MCVCMCAYICQEPTCQCRRHERCRFNPWVWEIPWGRSWESTPVFSSGESHGPGAWWAIVHRVSKSRTWLKWLSTHTHTQTHTNVYLSPPSQSSLPSHSHPIPLGHQWAPNWASCSKQYVTAIYFTHSCVYMGFPGSADGEESACNLGDLVWSLGQEDPLEKVMTTHSSILVRKIPWKEEPAWLQSMG